MERSSRNKTFLFANPQPSGILLALCLLCLYVLPVESAVPNGNERIDPASAVAGGVISSHQFNDESHRVVTNHSTRYKLVHFNFDHVEVPYVICLWILLASVAKIGFHLYDKLPRIFPESCLLVTLGILVGITLYFTETASSGQYSLDANTFFLFLLPPIIYDAGYHMPNRAFFNNIGTILLLAVVNTLWNTVGIGVCLWGMSRIGWINSSISLLHCFVFSSLISAVDPVAVLAIFEEIQVNEILYIIVFGESLLNDGVTVVLYHMMDGFTEIGESNLKAIDFVTGFAQFFIVVVGGTVIGVVYGLLGAFITKYTDHVRVIEPLFVFVLGYLAYLTAESMELSGILALTFGGIVMRHYTEINMAKKSTTTVKYFMKMLANISETIIFMFLGLSTVIDSHDFRLDFVLFSLLFCLVFRVTGVMMLSWLVNQRRVIRLSAIDQFIMSYGGLRGGIAFCLALLLSAEHIPERQMFVTTTTVIVYFTVFVQGITIKPVVNALKVERAEEWDTSMNEMIHKRFIDHLMAGVEDIVGKSGHNSIFQRFDYYNNKFLKPWLLRDSPKLRDTKILRGYDRLNMQDAKTVAKVFPVSIPREMSLTNLNEMSRSPSLANMARRATISVPSNRDMETVVNLHSNNPMFQSSMSNDPSSMLHDAMAEPRQSHLSERRHTLAEIHRQPNMNVDEAEDIRNFLTSIQRGADFNGNGNNLNSNNNPATSVGAGINGFTNRRSNSFNAGPTPDNNPGATDSPASLSGLPPGGRRVQKIKSFSQPHKRLTKKLSDVAEFHPDFAHEVSMPPNETAKPREVVFTLGHPAPPEKSPSNQDNNKAEEDNEEIPPTSTSKDLHLETLSTIHIGLHSGVTTQSPTAHPPEQAESETMNASFTLPCGVKQSCPTPQITSTDKDISSAEKTQNDCICNPTQTLPATEHTQDDALPPTTRPRTNSKPVDIPLGKRRSRHHHRQQQKHLANSSTSSSSQLSSDSPTKSGGDHRKIRHCRKSRDKHKRGANKPPKDYCKSKEWDIRKVESICRGTDSLRDCQCKLGNLGSTSSVCDNCNSNKLGCLPCSNDIDDDETLDCKISNVVSESFKDLGDISKDDCRGNDQREGHIRPPKNLDQSCSQVLVNICNYNTEDGKTAEKEKETGHGLDNQIKNVSLSSQKESVDQDLLQACCSLAQSLPETGTLAETSLPWRRDSSLSLVSLSAVPPSLSQTLPETSTLAETSLPWRRGTSVSPVPSSMSQSLPDDEKPLHSEAPSWADNPAYHRLTESGSPYHSPNTTITAEPQVERPRPVFDIFPSVEAAGDISLEGSGDAAKDSRNSVNCKDIENNSLQMAACSSSASFPPFPWSSANNTMEDICKNIDDDFPDSSAIFIPPPPWCCKNKDGNSAAADTNQHREAIPASPSLAGEQTGDKAASLLVSSHDDVPPSHHSCLQPRPLFNLHLHPAASLSSSHQHSQASSPLHFQAMNKQENLTMASIEAELIGIQADYHHSMKDRVSQWLAQSSPHHNNESDCLVHAEEEEKEREMILASLKQKRENWAMQQETDEGTDADVESDYEADD